jgi:hypothetical protein
MIHKVGKGPLLPIGVFDDSDGSSVINSIDDDIPAKLTKREFMPVQVP